MHDIDKGSKNQHYDVRQQNRTKLSSYIRKSYYMYVCEFLVTQQDICAVTQPNNRNSLVVHLDIWFPDAQLCNWCPVMQPDNLNINA